MKQLVYTISLLILILASCSKEDKAIVSGKIKNASGQTIYIEELRLRKNRIIDSCQLKKSGKLRFNLDLNYPGYYQIRLSQGQTLTLILSPGERFSIKADMNRFYESKILEGSSNTIRVNTLHDSLRASIKRINQLRNDYATLDEMTSISQQRLDSLTQEYNDFRNKYKKFTIGFILQDLKSLANIAALYQEYGEDDFVLYTNRDLQFFKLVSDTLNKYYPRVRYVKILKENYRSFFNDYQHARLMSMATPLETVVPELYLPDRNNKLQSLKSLKGNIVVLFFWSPKQAESVQHVVELQRVYKKYNNKGFEIYQVSIDKSIDDWKKTLDFEEIKWISVCDTAFPNSKTQQLYNVNTIPLNYLINKEQSEILARNLTADKLDERLQSLLNQN